MKKTVLIILVLGILSCVDEKDNIFKVSINAKFLEDDKIELHYINDFSNGTFNTKDREAIYIKGSNEFQLIELSLPKGVLPSKFRIDLGDNINMHETQIDINSVDIELNGNVINIDKTILDSFFQPNIYLERNENGYLRKVVKDKYDPFITSKAILIKKIELEL